MYMYVQMPYTETAFAEVGNSCYSTVETASSFGAKSFEICVFKSFDRDAVLHLQLGVGWNGFRIGPRP